MSLLSYKMAIKVNSMTVQKSLTTATLVLLGLTQLNVHAETAPDAGQVLQDALPDTTYRPLTPLAPLNLEDTVLKEDKEGGMRVRVTQIKLIGHSVFDDATLQAVVADALGAEHDLAGLRNIANRLSRYYHDQGYPFARAVLPQQKLGNGLLKIDLYEGRYGHVYTSGDESLAAQTQPWLGSLQSGEVITTGQLERTSLLLSDLPGIGVMPVMRPGELEGTGDLDVEVKPDDQIQSSLSADNYGSRASGKARTNISIRANRLLVLGDELSAAALYSEEDLWLGRVAYALPLGHSGLRGEIAYAHTEYDLREPFSGFSGTADIGSTRLSYPAIRRQQTNLTLSLSYQHKTMDDEQNAVSYQRKSSDSGAIALQFDHRDSIAGGGVSYGEIGITGGNLSNDASGATEGEFDYISLNLSRLQSLPGSFSLLANVQFQLADTPLDSSEAMSLGGANGVRAYPQGEVSGSRVWLTRLEARYHFKQDGTQQITPYLFYDHGQREAYRDESDDALAGGGIGLRYTNSAWSLDSALAFQTTRNATSEDEQRDPRFWIQMNYQF